MQQKNRKKMKVQIEIPKKAVNLAIAQISQSASNDDDLNILEQAVSRCNDEVTEIDISEEDDNMLIQIVLAMKAIAKRGEEIEKEQE